jgi:transposase-like protein
VDLPEGAKMREECPMEKRKASRARRSFNAEFKAEAVRLCKVGERTVGQAAEDLDLTETALREWVTLLPETRPRGASVTDWIA